MKTNQDYKNAALAALKGNWAPAVLATVLFTLITMVCVFPGQLYSIKIDASSLSADEALATLRTMLIIMGIGSLVYIFVLYPLVPGFLGAHRKLLVEGDNNLSSNMFSIALDGYGRKVWGMFLVALFIILWTFLFIIPGIVKGFAYSMTPFILEEHPELSANEAIDRSVAMMKGHKFDLFYLMLSFIGWGLLCIPTLMIGTLWLTPYIYTSMAAFYEDVKADYEQIAMD